MPVLSVLPELVPAVGGDGLGRRLFGEGLLSATRVNRLDNILIRSGANQRDYCRLGLPRWSWTPYPATTGSSCSKQFIPRVLIRHSSPRWTRRPRLLKDGCVRI
jgi:hypothetical protein